MIRSPDDDGLNGESAATLFIELGKSKKAASLWSLSGEGVAGEQGASCLLSSARGMVWHRGLAEVTFLSGNNGGSGSKLKSS
jgi:hypothetical protein